MNDLATFLAFYGAMLAAGAVVAAAASIVIAAAHILDQAWDRWDHRRKDRR